MKVFKQIFIWSLAIIIVAGLAWQIWRAASYEKPVRVYSETKGSLEIKLIAIGHENENVFYDVYGSVIDPLDLPNISSQRKTVYGSFYYMVFVFEIPKDKDIFFTNTAMHYEIKFQDEIFRGGSQNYRIVDLDDRRLMVVNCMIREHFGGRSLFGTDREKVSHIDVHFAYCCNQQKTDKHDYSIKGPFKAGTIAKAQGTIAPDLLFNEDTAGENQPTANFTLNSVNDRCIFVYDKNAKKHMITRKTRTGYPFGTTNTFYIKGVKHTEIGSVEFISQTDTHVFENVKINPPANEK